MLLGEATVDSWAFKYNESARKADTRNRCTHDKLGVGYLPKARWDVKQWWPHWFDNAKESEVNRFVESEGWHGVPRPGGGLTQLAFLD